MRVDSSSYVRGTAGGRAGSGRMVGRCKGRGCSCLSGGAGGESWTVVLTECRAQSVDMCTGSGLGCCGDDRSEGTSAADGWCRCRDCGRRMAMLLGVRWMVLEGGESGQQMV